MEKVGLGLTRESDADGGTELERKKKKDERIGRFARLACAPVFQFRPRAGLHSRDLNES